MMSSKTPEQKKLFSLFLIQLFKTEDRFAIKKIFSQTKHTFSLFFCTKSILGSHQNFIQGPTAHPTFTEKAEHCIP